MTDTSDTLWCLRTFTLLAIGGVWGVPRSGLMLQKTGINPPKMKLIDVMPHMIGMPMTANELLEFQREDFEAIKEHFAEAGIEIEGKI